MNLETYNELMDTLPGAFPTTRIDDFERVKAAWWPDLKGFEDADFISAITEVRRTSRAFPTLGAVMEALEKFRSERLDFAYRNRKREELSYEPNQGYSPRGLSNPQDREMARENMRVMISGLSLGPLGIIEEMKRLSEKYPKYAEWFKKTAFLVDQDHKEIMELDKQIHGRHECVKPAEAAPVKREMVCGKCKKAIDKGLWCPECKAQMYEGAKAKKP